MEVALSFLLLVFSITFDGVVGPSPGLSSHHRDHPHKWLNEPEGRQLAWKWLDKFNLHMFSHDSATEALKKWCAEHLAHSSGGEVTPEAKPQVEITTGKGGKKSLVRSSVQAEELPADLRKQLAVAGEEQVNVRKVELFCGERMLSEAELWYVPSRLDETTEEELQDNKDLPFGPTINKHLESPYKRHFLSYKLHWHPTPSDAELKGGKAEGELKVGHQVSEYFSILAKPDGVPFSVVKETYSNQNFDFDFELHAPK